MNIGKIRALSALALLAMIAVPAKAETPYSLANLAFLEGHWKGGDGDFVFEETWNEANGGVMTAMARGVSAGELKVLEYIIVIEALDAVIMRFKHFNHDYSTWEEAEPIVLQLSSAKNNDVTFTADPLSEDVKSIRYWMPDENTLQADIVVMENGEEGGFTLMFDRAD